ncbi:ABC transporter substrate-binding protein [Flexithrix dorotheae]|uniref:ABC transporter substrate-binding protein n=1 Tax=Flexithrix dorotheae TaxID=70993 RepID=UPI0003695CE1|nr:ABC transporter substrate-binding protein [Flexithrix dorotheae]
MKEIYKIVIRLRPVHTHLNGCVGRVFILLLIFSFSSCKNTSENINGNAVNNTTEDLYTQKTEIKEAIGFGVTYHGNYKLLHIFQHYEEESDTITYLLKPKDLPVPSGKENLPVINTPIKKLIALSSSHFGLIAQFDAYHTLAAISTKDYAWDEKILAGVASGEILEVGEGGSLNVEKVVELNPDVVMVIGFPGSKNKTYQTLSEFGIPVLLNAEWQEPTLTARAEWLKIMAVLLDQEEKGEKDFDHIVKSYQEMVELAKNTSEKLTTISGLPFKGTWHVPGGNSYVAKALNEAGANYFWKEDTSTGGIPMDFEMVYNKGLEADIWINPGVSRSKEDLLAKDSRFADLKPFKTGQIYNNNKRQKGAMGNDYYASGIVKPHIILADLIKIFQPELLPDHELFYFKKFD